MGQTAIRVRYEYEYCNHDAPNRRLLMHQTRPKYPYITYSLVRININTRTRTNRRFCLVGFVLVGPRGSS